jgi:hypothetical protein
MIIFFIFLLGASIKNDINKMSPNEIHQKQNIWKYATEIALSNSQDGDNYLELELELELVDDVDALLLELHNHKVQ